MSIVKRKIKKEKKVTIFDLSKQLGTTMLECSVCGLFTECSADAKTVICGLCVTKMIPIESKVAKKQKVVKVKQLKLRKDGKPRAKRGEGKKYVASGFPRGWHFKKVYVHTDGKTYSRGELVTDKKIIKQLLSN